MSMGGGWRASCKTTGQSGGIAAYDKTVQSATFGGTAVPKSRVTLQIPAAVKEIGQVSQEIFDNAQIGYCYIRAVSPSLTGQPLSQ